MDNTVAVQFQLQTTEFYVMPHLLVLVMVVGEGEMFPGQALLGTHILEGGSRVMAGCPLCSHGILFLRMPGFLPSVQTTPLGLHQLFNLLLGIQ